MMNKLLNMVKKHEGCKLNAYLCPAGVPTIGYGNTFYTDGKRVKLGDKITQQQADELLISTLNGFMSGIKQIVKQTLNENQLYALTSFAYNVGLGAFSKSTLLKKVSINPNDPTIAAEFAKWNKAGGKVLNGLVKRRKEEAELYFTKIV